MEAGKLRHRVTIQELTLTPDAHGGNIETWSDLATVWAKVEPAITRAASTWEFWTSQQLNISLAYIVTIRYLENINPLNRVKFGTRIFKIHAVINPSEGRRELQLMCEEVITSEE